MKHIRTQHGFTLLEVLVASAIFAMVSIGAMNMLTTAQQSQDIIEDGAESIFAMQRAMRMLNNDIGQITHRAHRDEFGDITSLVKGNSDRAGIQSFVEFTRAGWRNPIGLPRSSLQHVRYQLEENQLVRYHWQYLDQASGAVPFKRILLDGVEELDFQFMYQRRWVENWPQDQYNTQDKTIPQAILVRLKTDDFGDITRIIRVGG